MNFKKLVELMVKYSNCPECDNEFIGNREGTLTVEEDAFVRTCKCGWEIKIKEK